MIHRDRYCIWIVSPEGLIWSRVFDEVALSLQEAFAALGYEVPVVRKASEVRGTAIVLGANMLPMMETPPPSSCILFNLEQVHPASRWFAPDYGYLELLKRYPVWDFSPVNIKALAALGVEPVTLCRIGYSPVLTRGLKAEPEVDVMFIGGGHPRRNRVVDDIRARGARFEQVYRVFGQERDERMVRAKIHLNMHKEQAELFEIVRVSYLLANGCFVVSEPGKDASLEDPLKHGMVFASYETLTDTCIEFLEKPAERKAIAEAGFEAIRALPQRDFLAQALEEHEVYSRAPQVRRQRIFVSIASFRDPEIGPTLENLMKQAAQPERVHAGICLQLEEGDAGCDIDEAQYGGRVRVERVKASESGGANWARARALKLRNGEDYVLMIDSHMRFEPGWDVTLIDMLSRCPSAQPVVSGYVPNYDPPERLFRHEGQLIRVRVKGVGREDDPQGVHLTGELVKVSDPVRGGLYPSPFCVGNFIFAQAEAIAKVLPDARFYFWGDELHLSARLWTHGFDIFQPDKVVAYHYWVRKDQLHLHGYRNPTHEKNKAAALVLNHALATGEGLGDARSMDDFWAFAGIDWHKRRMSGRAKKGLWELGVLERMGVHKETGPKRPRIFVQIASYRDPDCQHTVRDLFEKAVHPERIFVGICWQFVKKEDDICFSVPYPYPEQVRVHEEDARTGKGACWARSLVQKLWRGEEFTLQIDSHMRFEPGWDEILMNQWHACEDSRAVLTCYPPGFTPPDTLQKEWVFGMAAKFFDANGILLMHGKPGFSTLALPERPIPGAFVSANMLFGKSSIIEDVPYDPYLYFFGEEISLAVRMWTSGYNLYHPNQLVVYHDWDRGKRPTHFTDHKDWGHLNIKSFARVRHMLGTEVSRDPVVTAELDRYGLGRARTLADYQAFSGVDFAKKTLAPYTLEGVFPRPGAARVISSLPELQQKEGHMPRIFVNIASYRDPECQHTVRDLFEKAAHPDRVFVGICWQFDEEEDKHCFEVTTRPEQVRIFPAKWEEAEGVCWARHQAQQLWDGEEYTLMIDSHMRFTQGWDEQMLAELARCPGPKPVLSSSPEQYTPPNELGTRMLPTVRRAKQFTPDGNIRCQGEALDRAPDAPLRGAFLVANFVFSRSEIIKEVPYDPYLYFDQEEITYAARLYTHGWDIYHPTKQIIYHYYNDAKVPGGSVRKLHWRDLREANEARIRFLRERGLERFNHMTGFARSYDSEVIRELDVYGFGRERTLEDYEAFSGVDFKLKLASDRALQCEFIEGLRRWRERPFRIPEPEMAAQGAILSRIARSQSGSATHGALALAQHPLQVPLKTAAAAYSLLEEGDFLPLFDVPDHERRMFQLERMGGQACVFIYVPSAEPEFAAAVCREMLAALGDAPHSVMMDDEPDRLARLRETFGVKQTLLADPDRRFGRAMGIWQAGMRTTPTVFVLSHNLKIVARHRDLDPAALAGKAVNSLREQLARFEKEYPEPKLIRATAPALIVPDVLGEKLRERCIEAFKQGHTFDGTVGERRDYRADVKVRTDFIVRGNLLDELDDKFSRSFFPEIKKAFGVDVLFRENYKIGLYKGDNGGFFKQHRDNYDTPMGYRRIASTIHLNDDYQGGGLRFAEYGPDIYRPDAGGAIAFSASMLHEALPVTGGERYVIVAFLHGAEEEAYRRYYLMGQGKPVPERQFLAKVRSYPGMREARWFYKDWYERFVRFDGRGAQEAATTAAAPVHSSAANVNEPRATAPVNLVIRHDGQHMPRKIYEGKGGIIYDDFLPPELYLKVQNWSKMADYQYINTTGKLNRAWHVQDGFPLRSVDNFFYHHQPAADKNPYDYPMGNDIDGFVRSILAIQPEVEHLIGRQGADWAHFSVTGWLYPPGTSLAMHDDGSGVYTGAYAFFLNETWRAHWGGLLLMMEDEANQAVARHRAGVDQIEFHRRKYLHAGGMDDLLLEHGMAKCIFPKGNRMVFIANDAYHTVTRVNEQAGDNIRMSLAGFFNRKK